MTDEVITLGQLQAWIREFARLIDEQKDELTALDAAIGDADHGTNMERGLSAALQKLEATSVAELFKNVGMTLVSKVGGTSGPLYGTFFLRFGTAAGDTTTLDPPAFIDAVVAGVAGVVSRGKAEPRDKTMLDALWPAVEALQAGGGQAGGGESLAAALKDAVTAAERGRDATVEMTARKGRASYLGARSVGHQDPGATSAALLIRAAASALG